MKKGAPKRHRTDRDNKLRRMRDDKTNIKVKMGKDYPLANIDRCIELNIRMTRPNYTIMENGVIADVEYKENGQYILLNSAGRRLGVIRNSLELYCLHNEDLADIMNLVTSEDHPHYQILDIFKQRAAAVIQERNRATIKQQRRMKRE